MAITLQITDGATTFDLVYNSSTQPYYHARKGLLVVSEDTDVLQHNPDDGEPVPIRGNDMDRTVQFTSDVLGASQDEVLNKIAALKRFIDGKDQQALRYWTVGDVNRVDLKIQLENATNYTLNPIKWGHVDDSGAHYVASAQNSGYAIGIQVTLHLTAYGEGAPITLRNDLASSPHFLEDSAADGIADGWAVSGMSATSIPSFRWMVGGKTQLCTTASSGNSLIQSAQITLASAQEVCASGWIAIATASSDTIYFRITDGSGVTVQEKAISSADTSNATQSIISQSGHDFYRMDVGGTLANANYRVSWIRKSADATKENSFYIDLCYAQSGTTTAPNAWCSTSAIQNRYDPTSTSAATEARINYLDVWGVPGDSSAAVTLKVAPQNVQSDQKGWAIAKSTDGKYLAANLGCVYSATHSGWTYTPGFTSTADTDALNGTARQCTSNSTATLALTGETAQAFASKPRRIFVLGETNTGSSASTVDMIAYIEVAGLERFNYETTVDVTFVHSGEYEWLDLGLINIDGVIPDTVPNSSLINVTIEIGYTRAGSETLKFSGIYAMPLDSEDGLAILNLVVPTTEFWLGNGDGSLIDGRMAMNRPYAGRISTVASGNKMTRFNFSSYDGDLDDLYHNITGTSIVTVEVTPRTRHLLGTA